MMLPNKTACGSRLFISVAMLSLVLFFTSQNSTRADTKSSMQLQGMWIIGEVEPVTILAADLTLPARIDTGAQTSSLDAWDIQRLERDGKKCVRFVIVDRISGNKAKCMNNSHISGTIMASRYEI